VAYILTHPIEAQKGHSEYLLHKAAVESAIDVGAIVINLSFSRMPDEDLADTDAMLPGLQTIFDAKWTSTTPGQRAYSWRKCGSVMSFFLNSRVTLLAEAVIDPENTLPALSLAFKTPTEVMCVVTTSVPALPKLARGRMLNAYVNFATAHQPGVILIGGFFADSVPFIENEANKLDLDFELFTNANLCLLAHHPGVLEPGELCDFVSYALDTDGPYSQIAQWSRPRSVGRPAEPAVRGPPVGQSITWRSATPLYDSLLAMLEPAVRQHSSGESFMWYITQCCFCDKLLLKDPFGNDLDTPVPISWKMEQLLGTCRKQRQLHLDRIKQRGVHEAAELSNRHFNEDEMKYIYNTWRKDVQSWMREDTRARYVNLGRWPAQAHKIEKQAFSSYLFHISGCKFLLHCLIKLPIIPDSAEQPVSHSDEKPVGDVLCALINAYEDHKHTPEYQRAVETSRKKQEDHRRLSCQIWWAQHNYQQGKKLSRMLQDSVVNFDVLTSAEQSLVEDFNTSRARCELDKLLAQKRTNLLYRGAASVAV